MFHFDVKVVVVVVVIVVVVVVVVFSDVISILFASLRALETLNGSTLARRFCHLRP